MAVRTEKTRVAGPVVESIPVLVIDNVNPYGAGGGSRTPKKAVFKAACVCLLRHTRMVLGEGLEPSIAEPKSAGFAN